MFPQGEERHRRRRVRYWSALALLRCVSSSPAAAAATLRSRAAVDEAPEDEDVDEVGRRTVLDQGMTTTLLRSTSVLARNRDSPRSARSLLEFARRARGINAEADQKLQGAVRRGQGSIKDGFHPAVFCRFVDTADYLARRLREV